MGNATTRLTLDNDRENLINATLEMTMSSGESIRLNFFLPKEQGSRTIHEIELAMFRRVQEVTAHILKS